MPESMMQCPVCGKMFPTRLAVIDDNGNAICPDHVEKPDAPKKKSEEPTADSKK